MVHDGLIKRLREIHPEEFDDVWDFAFACQQAMHEAADAIEGLICEVADEHNARLDAEERQRWIPITNADRIRSMSDEELAEYFDGVCHDLWQMFVKDPQKMWLDWLRKEYKNGDKNE